MIEHAGSDFGGQLRLAREKRGVSLDQISHQTKISVSLLEALERNEIARLPGGIFSRAFVRSYATEVGLDPERTVQEFLDRFPHASVAVGRPSLVDDLDERESVESEQQIAQTAFKLLLFSLPIVAAILYFTFAVRMGTPAATDPVRPEAEIPRLASIPEPESSPPDEPIGTAGNMSPAEMTESDDRELVISLKTTGPCWISASADGKRILTRLLPPGDQAVLRAGREIVLTAGDAGALSLQINGKDAAPLGKAGAVVTRRITPANYRAFLSGQ